MASQRLSHPAP